MPEKRLPPDWFDDAATYSAQYRGPINLLWREDNQILNKKYEGVTTETSMVADAVMYSYMETGRPQSLAGLCYAMGRGEKEIKAFLF